MGSRCWRRTEEWLERSRPAASPPATWSKCPPKLNWPCGTSILAEWLVNFQLKRLPEGSYLATCESIPGLVAQGRTVTETLEIARDVAKKLHEARLERGEPEVAAPLAQSFELPVVLSAPSAKKVDASAAWVNPTPLRD